MKKIFIIIISLIAISLIGTGVYLSTTTSSNAKENNQPTEEEYQEPDTKQKEFPSISTPDNKIVLSNTTVYYRDEISAFDIEITSKENIIDLYLLIEFDLETEKHLRAVYIKNINANETKKTQVQTEKDLTKALSWSVKQATKDEVIASGFDI